MQEVDQNQQEEFQQNPIEEQEREEEEEEYDDQYQENEEYEDEEDKENVQLDADNILEYIEVLDAHRIKCQQEGNYIEAELAKNKIKELKVQHEQSQKEELKANHLNEKLEMEETHLEEFNQFNEIWDQRMEDFTEQAEKLEDEMIENHKAELEEFVEAIINNLPEAPKETSEILNLHKIEQSLVKQQNYLEAHKVQQIRNELYEQTQIKWEHTKLEKVKHHKIQLEQKQTVELSALRKKIESGKEEQQKQRSMELERLLQKYQNLKKELEKSQKQELNCFDKKFKNPTSSRSTYARRSMYGSRFGGSRYSNAPRESVKSRASKRSQKKSRF